MKPNNNFKLPRRFKYLLASIVDDYQRNAFRANLIQAQLQSLIKPVKEKKLPYDVSTTLENMVGLKLA